MYSRLRLKVGEGWALGFDLGDTSLELPPVDLTKQVRLVSQLYKQESHRSCRGNYDDAYCKIIQARGQIHKPKKDYIGE